MDGNPGDLMLTSRSDLERLCDLAGRMGLVQLPLFRAAADGVLALVRVEDVSTPWPEWLIERNQHRPICFMVGADPGFGHPDPAPAAWACALRLRDWCHAAIVHGAVGNAAHYRDAAASTLILRQLAFIETTSARAADWYAFLRCPRTLVIVPTTGVHPLPIERGRMQ